MTLEEVSGSRGWGTGLCGLELGQHGEAAGNPAYRGPRSSPCWQSSSPHLHGAFGVEPGSHVPSWLLLSTFL